MSSNHQDAIVRLEALKKSANSYKSHLQISGTLQTVTSLFTDNDENLTALKFDYITC